MYPIFAAVRTCGGYSYRGRLLCHWLSFSRFSASIICVRSGAVIASRPSSNRFVRKFVLTFAPFSYVTSAYAQTAVVPGLFV